MTVSIWIVVSLTGIPVNVFVFKGNRYIIAANRW
jgi:hypothetical protein